MKSFFQIIYRFFHLMKGNKIGMFYLGLTSFFMHLFSLLLPLAASFIIRYLTQANFSSTLLWISLFACFSLFYYIFYALNYNAYTKSNCSVYTNLQDKVLKKVATYDSDFSQIISRGKILNTTNEDIRNLSFLGREIIELVACFLQVIYLIVFILFIHIPIGIMTCFIVLVYLFLLDRNNKKIVCKLNEQKQQADLISNVFSETLSGLQEINSFQMMPKLSIQFAKIRQDYEIAYQEKMKYVRKKYTKFPLLVMGYKIILYVFFSLFVLWKKISLDLFVLFMSYYDNLISNVDQMMVHANCIRENAVALTRIESILQYQGKQALLFGEVILTHPKQIRFERVTFGYDTSLVKETTFTLYPNTWYGIVGKSGSGKSFLLSLLLRRKQPLTGTIFLDDCDLNQLSDVDFSSVVGMVSQFPFLFSMSILDNFKLVEEEEEKIKMVCKKLGIHSFIESLQDGYHTILREDANSLSGGQKQLLSICRLLLKNPYIMLFDEITSALDPKTTIHVLNVIEELKKDHFIFMVTHKEEVMKHVDSFIVFDHGEIKILDPD